MHPEGVQVSPVEAVPSRLKWCFRWQQSVASLWKHVTDRERVIALVSGWIQSSPEAWCNCFKAILVLVLAHLAAQTWYAVPSSGDAHGSVTEWHTTRRVCLAQIGLTSFAATVSLHMQVCGLVGTEGIIPFSQHAADRIRRHTPNVKLLSWERVRSDPLRWALRCLNVVEARWWAHGCKIDQQCPYDWWHMKGSGLTDSKLTQLCWIGEAASAIVVLLAIGEGSFCSAGALGVLVECVLGFLRVAALLAATLTYRILRNCASVFCALQWDSLIIESNLLALPLALPLLPNAWLPALLLPLQLCGFKCMFGAGVVKRRSRCPRWAASTAMDLHYETQPLPHMAAWYTHAWPHWLHAHECWIAFLIQLPLTFFQWGTWHCRLFAFMGYAALMTAITATGNYGFFTFQVLGLTVSVLDDSLIPLTLPPPCSPLPRWIVVALLPAVATLGLWIAAACGYSLLQLPRLSSVLGPIESGSLAERSLAAAQRAHEALNPLGIGNSYGPFAGMTTFRWELIFELSQDGENWSQVEFPYKPGCVDTWPRWMPIGHFARLDWRLWFVPLGMGRGRWDLPDWVDGFIVQLLQGSEPVAALTQQRDTIVASPPKYVRVSVWDYHLSSCDPAVHRCPQVTLTSEECEGAARRSCGGDAPPPCKGEAENMKEPPPPLTEWGRWWYRRLVRRCGVYFLMEGQMQVIPAEGFKVYKY
mmetsp:Transcript_52865/g.113292  ORF Transcript_52865/g.113292 Transcript_52865/m.113292 type:complete len:701 (-) Transcript_52865:37-2139(-)